MAVPLRQSSWWLHDEIVAHATLHQDEENDKEPSATEGYLASASLSRPSAGLDDFLDESGKDRRVCVASTTGSDEEDEALSEHWFTWRKLWLFTGPGFLMSIAYLVTVSCLLRSALLQFLLAK